MTTIADDEFCGGCGSQQKMIRFHRSRYGHGPSTCNDDDAHTRDTPHLHLRCEECGYDWTMDTNLPTSAAPDSTGARE